MGLKTFLLLVGSFLCSTTVARGGFFTFYFPNALKPKGFNEISDMIDKLNNQINEIKDQHSDSLYFWKLMKELDEAVIGVLPEQSACSEIFPLFRDLAIDYVHIDYEHYIKPIEEYKKHLIGFRTRWYPGGIESKAALPRIWEQNLLAYELHVKIKWFDRLTNADRYRVKRQQMIDIWKKVRRSLDYSLPCIYLRYAYRQIAEDISQVALNANLEGMKEARKALIDAYGVIQKFKDSDNLIFADIRDEIEKEKRNNIKFK